MDDVAAFSKSRGCLTACRVDGFSIRTNLPIIRSCAADDECGDDNVDDQSSNLELVLSGGETAPVSLQSEADVKVAAAQIALEFPDINVEDLERELMISWLDSCRKSTPAYNGPSPGEGKLEGLEVSLPLPEVGLVLEVAQSVVSGAAGRGLFIRLLDGFERVTLQEGTAVCGYAAGSMHTDADSMGGKTVAFCLRSPSTSVWFERELYTVSELLNRDDVDSIAGHVAVRGEDEGRLIERLEIDATYQGPRYFVPDEVQPELSITNIGCLANDLAIGGAGDDSDESYADRSNTANVLVLVQRLERDHADRNLLLPSRPITTLATSVTFSNKEPMEIGCHYGERYWGVVRLPEGEADR